MNLCYSFHNHIQIITNLNGQKKSVIVINYVGGLITKIQQMIPTFFYTFNYVMPNLVLIISRYHWINKLKIHTYLIYHL